MKKVLYSIAAISALMFVSCAKETEIATEYTSAPEVQKGGYTYTIVATLDNETKTTYENEKTFSWKAGDKIQILTVKESDPTVTGTAVLEAQGNGASVQFKGTIDEGYVAGDYALYPYGTGDSSYSSDLQFQSDGTVRLWGTMTPDLDNPLGSVPLVGKKGSGNDFTFKTATGIVKLELTNIPSSARYVCFDLPDNDTYALNGNFTLSDSDGDARIISASEVSGSKWGQKYIKFTPADNCESRTFYFAIPVGTVPAGLVVSVCDENLATLATVATTKSAMTLPVNKILNIGTQRVPDIWNSLGTGKFIDNFLWYRLITQGRVAADVPGYVNVEIQQNNSDGNQYRVVNPYAAAQAAFGYTSPGSPETPSDYLTFTVDGTNVTAFETHDTGITDGSNDRNIELVYPETTTRNLVLASGTSYPDIVQLAPIYRYKEEPTAKYDKSGFTGMIRIMFPDASGYEGSFTAGSSNATLNALQYTKDSKPGQIRLIISQYNDVQIAAGATTQSASADAIENWPSVSSRANYTQASGTLNWSSYLPSSGALYLSWFTRDDNTKRNILSQGSVKVYGLKASDVTALCKQHTSTGYKGSTQTDALSGSYTFAVSDDPANSNIMMTEFDGLCCTVSEMTEPAASHQIYSSLSWIAPSTTTWTGADPVFTDGSPQYGVLSGSSILLDATQPFFHRGSVNVYIYSYTDYAGNGRGAANTPERFKFTVSEGKVNVGETYVNARFDGNNMASAPYANTITEVTE